jgi:hypothetical protein
MGFFDSLWGWADYEPKPLTNAPTQAQQEWLNSLLCSGAGLTTPRRIGRTPRIT